MNLTPRILVADDDLAVLRLLERMLTEAGYRCAATGNAGDALRALTECEYDLFICDIVMPGNDKLSLVREAAKIAGGMPVILLTGYPTIETAIESLHLPVVEYLIKPIQYADVIRHVEEALERSRILSVVEAARQRNDTMAHELQRILQAAIAAIPASGKTEATVRELADGNFVASAAALFESQRELLTETLQVLKATKTAFKSKDLGALRKKIETFLKKNP